MWDQVGKQEKGSKGSKGSLEQRLKAHPELRAKVEVLLDVVEDAGEDLQKADVAEQRVLEELRQMGNQILREWAKGQEQKKSRQTQQQPGVQRKGKKNSTGTAAWGKLRSTSRSTLADGKAP
jgi:hypothetical protein